MYKRYLKLFLLSAIVATLSGCATPQTADVVVTETPVQTEAPVPTVTNVPTPTLTFAPTETPVPTATSTPTPTPSPTPIPHIHVWVAKVTEATCMEDGLSREECDCGEIQNEVTIPALGHRKCRYRVITEATLKEEGSYETTCEACGAVVSSGAVPKLTPTPTPTPSPTPRPTATPKPTATPTPTATPKLSPTSKLEYYTSNTWKHARIGDKIYFGTYEQDNNFNNGTEEIEWIILDEDENYFMLYSMYALKAMAFSETGNYGITWEDSDVRQWLNKEFYVQAFSDEEKEKIALINTDSWLHNPDYNTISGKSNQVRYEETSDYVWLLSYGEYEERWRRDSKTFASNKISDYVVAQGYDIYVSGERQYNQLWTSTSCTSGTAFSYGYTVDRMARTGGSINTLQEKYLLCPVIWVAKEGTAEEKNTWTSEELFKTATEGETIVITGTVDNDLTTISIPAVINGKKVVGIASGAFSNCTNLTRIKLPENIKEIDGAAFLGCDKLIELYLPSTLERLDKTLISEIDSLKQINCALNINENVKESLEKAKINTVYANNVTLYELLYTDQSRSGWWDLTYREFIEMYQSIGTENDLFQKMLKERGPYHSEAFEYDFVPNLDITFESITAEKLYALHYAPFQYVEKSVGGKTKGVLNMYQDHGGVCSTLVSVYKHFIRNILGEKDWKYAYYGNAETNHAVLLVQTEEGKVVQFDNCKVDYWWLGMEFVPDESKIMHQDNARSEYVAQRFNQWKSDFAERNKIITGDFYLYLKSESGKLNIKRPIRYNVETGEASTYLGGEMPQAYIVTCTGLPGKVIGLTTEMNLDGFCDLEDISFED